MNAGTVEDYPNKTRYAQRSIRIFTALSKYYTIDRSSLKISLSTCRMERVMEAIWFHHNYTTEYNPFKTARVE